MPRITPLNCRSIESKLHKLGFVLDHTDASSIRYYIRTVNGIESLAQIHWHPGDRGKDIIMNIIRQGNITRKEWFSV